jgi:hypothetical protein
MSDHHSRTSPLGTTNTPTLYSGLRINARREVSRSGVSTLTVPITPMAAIEAVSLGVVDVVEKLDVAEHKHSTACLVISALPCSETMSINSLFTYKLPGIIGNRRFHTVRYAIEVKCNKCKVTIASPLQRYLESNHIFKTAEASSSCCPAALGNYYDF